MLGIVVLLRMFGNLKGILGICLVSFFVELELFFGVIVVQWYIYMLLFDVLILWVFYGDRVLVVIEGDDCGLIFNNVVICVLLDMCFEMYIDIDEVNVVGVDNLQVFVWLVGL